MFKNLNRSISIKCEASHGNSGGTYEVEKIMSHRTNSDSKITHLLIKWVGYSAEESTWEPLETMSADIPLLVEEYMQSLNPKSSSKYKGKKATEKSRLISRMRSTFSKPIRKGRLDKDDIPESIEIIYRDEEDRLSFYVKWRQREGMKILNSIVKADKLKRKHLKFFAEEMQSIVLQWSKQTDI